MGEFDEVSVLKGGKRVGLQWTPWMGDWFTSWSPRNDNNNAEGPWDQWVDMAIKILKHPATQITRPAAFTAVTDLEPRDYYSTCDRDLNEQEIRDLFGGGRE